MLRFFKAHLLTTIIMAFVWLPARVSSQTTSIADSAHQFIFSEQYTEAVNLLNHEISVNKQSPQMLRLLGDAYYHLKEYDKARNAYTQVIDITHCDSCYQDYEQLGNISLIAKDYDKAIAYLDTAVKRGSKTAANHIIMAYSIIGDDYFRQQLYKIAIKYYQRGLEYNEDTLMYQRLLICYYQQHDDDSVMKLGEQSLKKFPYFVSPRFYVGTVYSNKADIFFKEAEYTEALPLLSKAYQYFPDDPQLCFKLGVCYDTLKDKERAAYYYQRSHQLGNDTVDLYLNLGRVYYDLACYPEALQCALLGIGRGTLWLEDFPINDLEFSPQDQQILLLLSNVLNKLGDSVLSLYSYMEAAKVGCDKCQKKLTNMGIFFNEKDIKAAMLYLLLYPKYFPENRIQSGTSSVPPDYVPVDKSPVPTKQVPPEYPETAKQAGISGTVLVKCIVGKDGLVKKAVILTSNAETLNTPAMNAAMQWKFTPAIMNNAPVEVWVAIPFRFVLNR